jgi:transposase InsO family protein
VVQSLCGSVARCSGEEESATTWHRRSAGGIRRLWRDEGLPVPQRRKKNRLTGIGVAVGVMSPIRPNVIWAMDFQLDTTADGRTLKMLNVIDGFTREALGIHAPTWAPHYVRFAFRPSSVSPRRVRVIAFELT